MNYVPFPRPRYSLLTTYLRHPFLHSSLLSPSPVAVSVSQIILILSISFHRTSLPRLSSPNHPITQSPNQSSASFPTLLKCNVSSCWVCFLWFSKVFKTFYLHFYFISLSNYFCEELYCLLSLLVLSFFLSARNHTFLLYLCMRLCHRFRTFPSWELLTSWE